MTIEHKHEFVARGEVFRGRFSVPAVFKGSYMQYDLKAVRCVVMPDMQDLQDAGRIFDEKSTISLRGKTESGKQIWIPSFKVLEHWHHRELNETSVAQVSWTGEAEFFVEGNLDVFDASNGKILYFLRTNSTRLAESNVLYWPQPDGTITLEEGGERIPIRWTTPIGEAKFADSYAFRGGKAGIYSSLIRVKTFGVEVERRLVGKTSLGTLLTEIQDSFDSAFLLISFLSRKRVGWYEAEASFVPEDNSAQDLRIAVARRQLWLGFEPDTESEWSTWPLVTSAEVNNRRFEVTLSRFNELLETKSFLKTVIYHLLMSHEQGYIESRYTNAYTALECLVSNLAREEGLDTILSDVQFAQLKQEVEDNVIRTQFAGEENRKIRAALYRKVRELQRRAFSDTLLLLMDEYKVDISRLWPPNTNVGEAIKNIVSRRNRYIHEGRIVSGQILIYDLNRIQNLVELWVLKLLGWSQAEVAKIHVGQSVPIYSREGPV